MYVTVIHNTGTFVHVGICVTPMCRGSMQLESVMCDTYFLIGMKYHSVRCICMRLQGGELPIDNVSDIGHNQQCRRWTNDAQRQWRMCHKLWPMINTAAVNDSCNFCMWRPVTSMCRMVKQPIIHHSDACWHFATVVHDVESDFLHSECTQTCARDV